MDEYTARYIARALCGVREWAGIPLDDALTAQGCGWVRTGRPGAWRYRDTANDDQWATVKPTRDGRWLVEGHGEFRRELHGEGDAHDLAREHATEGWCC